MTESARATGVLLGLACGDALGRPVEFQSADQIAAEYGTLTEMVGYGTWNKPAGTTTDDTDLAMCIASSLSDNGEFDPEDIAERFVAWYDTEPFDVGRMTAMSIQNLKRGSPWDEAGQEVWESQPEGSNAGNGSVMRCPPLAISHAAAPERLLDVSRQSSQITHADPRCTWGCALLNRTIAGYLRDEADPLRAAVDAVQPEAPAELVDRIAAIPGHDIPETELRPSGYVIDTLQVGLYDAVHADSAKDAIIRAVNRGEDTDTVGAVAGAVAGARFGAEALPDQWVTTLDRTDSLRDAASTLDELDPASE